ncbi:MAG: hypothetical protein QF788_04490, partial [SAR324 cluster bacterium]|nr:hypothetical protein [SAR324 cluster bacterium]
LQNIIIKCLPLVITIISKRYSNPTFYIFIHVMGQKIRGFLESVLRENWSFKSWKRFKFSTILENPKTYY